MKECKECKTEFEPENPKGVFCSDACRQKDYRKKVKKELELFRAGKAKPIVPDKKGDMEPTAELKKTKTVLQKELSELEKEVMPQYVNHNVWKIKHKKRIEELKLLISNSK